MLKNILNLEGAQQLTKTEQKSINGGVTDSCNRAILSGACVRKGSAPCPNDFPFVMTGGCCCS